MTHHNLCEELPAYLMGELDSPAREAFVHHLRHCSKCQVQAVQLWDVHERLLTGDSVDGSQVAALEMKDRVLNRVLTQAPASSGDSYVKHKVGLHPSFHAPHRRRRLRWASVAALAVGIALGIGIGNVRFPGFHRRDAIQSIALASTSVNPSAKATIVILQDEVAKHFMIATSHMTPNDQWSCYDVWLIERSHHYRRIAEFAVGSSGTGTMAAYVPPHLAFEGIEITQEATWGNARPEGPVVLHANVVNQA